MLSERKLKLLQKEFLYRTSRSGGSGGQHINKVSSKVEAIFDIDSSIALSGFQKTLLKRQASKYVNSSNSISISVQEDRSQYRNKQIATKKLTAIILKGIQVKKNRRATSLPKAVKEKRLSQKKKHAEKKARRKSPET